LNLELRSQRFGGKSEPLDGDLVPEQPRLLRRAVGMLVEQGVMPRETIPERIGLSAGDIENLAGLSEGYFAPSASGVVDLNAVRLRRA